MGLCGYPDGFLPFLVLQTLLFVALLKEKFCRAFPPVVHAPGSASTLELLMPAASGSVAGGRPVSLRRLSSVCDSGWGSPSTCGVCLEEVEGDQEEVGELPSCRHFFHKGCLERWVGDHLHRTCPLCRSLL